MIKLVAVDMDGTFLDDQMHYNRTIFRKIYNYFKENDIYFVVASGNQYYQLKSFLMIIKMKLLTLVKMVHISLKIKKKFFTVKSINKIFIQ